MRSCGGKCQNCPFPTFSFIAVSSDKAFGTASQVRRTSGTILLTELNIRG